MRVVLACVDVAQEKLQDALPALYAPTVTETVVRAGGCVKGMALTAATAMYTSTASICFLMLVVSGSALSAEIDVKCAASVSRR